MKTENGLLKLYRDNDDVRALANKIYAISPKSGCETCNFAPDLSSIRLAVQRLGIYFCPACEGDGDFHLAVCAHAPGN